MNNRKLSKEEFIAFLKNMSDNNFINDWLSLARSKYININNQKIARSTIDNARVKFVAYFTSFSHFVALYNIEFYKNYELSVKENIELFLSDCGYLNPNLITENLDIFKNLWNINSNLFNDEISEKTLSELSYILETFFEKIQQL